MSDEFTNDEIEQANFDMKAERNRRTYVAFFNDVGQHPIIEERPTGATHYTVEELYQFFKARLAAENTKDFTIPLSENIIT